MLAALAGLERPSTVAVGRDLDPSRFGPQPPHLQVVRYADFASLLPRASVVMHHGGSGMLVGSALHGTPQVLLPMGADQPFNGDRVDALGVGAALDVLSATTEDIRGAVEAVAADPHARSCAA
ncbi:glycosyltransferase, partial [Bacillus sp. SIMBA_069]